MIKTIVGYLDFNKPTSTQKFGWGYRAINLMVFSDNTFSLGLSLSETDADDTVTITFDDSAELLRKVREAIENPED